MSEKMYTTTEAANMLDISPGRVRQMVADGLIKATRIGRDNFISDSELEKARNRATKPGPKPKSVIKKK